MLTERFPIESTPPGAFVYVLHFEDTNFIMLGVGYESSTKLQLTHVQGVPIHGTAAHEIADAILDAGLALPTGRLASYFLGEPEHLVFEDDQMALRVKVAYGLRRIHDQVWGHPLDWEPEFVDLLDGRFVWIAYGSDIDKLRIGIGFINESNERILGDACYTVPPYFVAEFTTEPFTRPVGMYFFSTPPRWPSHFDRTTDADQTRQVMVKVLGLADQVWPGKVDENVPHTLTGDAVLAMNSQPVHAEAKSL